MDKRCLTELTSLQKEKEQGLTEAETKEQKELYKIYLGEIRTQFNATLDNVSVEEKDGTVKPFKEAYKSRMTKLILTFKQKSCENLITQSNKKQFQNWNCFCFIKLFNYLYLLPPFWLFFGS